MTRDELIETMARAGDRAGIQSEHLSRCAATFMASAIEAEGLAIVPVEATDAMADTGTEARWKSAVRDADNAREIYRAMIEAGRL